MVPCQFSTYLALEEASMKRSSLSILTLFVVLGVMLSACGPSAAPTQAPAVEQTQAPTEASQPTEAPAATQATGAEKTAVIGFTASLTGSLNVESTRQNNGLKLWMDQVNAAGGIKLADGTVVKFTSKF